MHENTMPPREAGRNTISIIEHEALAAAIERVRVQVPWLAIAGASPGKAALARHLRRAAGELEFLKTRLRGVMWREHGHQVPVPAGYRADEAYDDGHPGIATRLEDLQALIGQITELLIVSRSIQRRWPDLTHHLRVARRELGHAVRAIERHRAKTQGA
jgi:hypothetical protein